MDYTEYLEKALSHYWSSFGFLLVFIVAFCLISVWCLRMFLSGREIKNLLFSIGFMLVMIICTYMSRGIFFDIPNVMNHNYLVDEGTVKWNNSGGGEGFQSRTIILITDEAEEIEVSVVAERIYKGERLEVIYFPRSGIGAIVRRISNEELKETG